MLTHAVGNDPFTEASYVCVATDLLTRTLADLQLLEINNQRLLLTMAAAGHDLRQRLHTLLGTVELLRSSTMTARSIELSQHAKSQILRLATELEQLALQAECDQNRRGPMVCAFFISSFLAKVRNDWESEAAAKCLDFSVGQADCAVESDQRFLAVILNNVIGNAVKYTARGGVTVASTIDDQFLVLSVSDTGPGITDEDIRRSFSFSSRLRGFNEGLGLGLSIARKTAEMLGHEFAVSAGRNGGTCIRLYVPLA